MISIVVIVTVTLITGSRRTSREDRAVSEVTPPCAAQLKQSINVLTVIVSSNRNSRLSRAETNLRSAQVRA